MDTKRCPMCAEEIAAAALKCKHCHHVIVPAEERMAALRSEVQAKKKDPWLALMLALVFGPVGLLYGARLPGCVGPGGLVAVPDPRRQREEQAGEDRQHGDAVEAEADRRQHPQLVEAAVVRQAAAQEDRRRPQGRQQGGHGEGQHGAADGVVGLAPAAAIVCGLIGLIGGSMLPIIFLLPLWAVSALLAVLAVRSRNARLDQVLRSSAAK